MNEISDRCAQLLSFRLNRTVSILKIAPVSTWALSRRWPPQLTRPDGSFRSHFSLIFCYSRWSRSTSWSVLSDTPRPIFCPLDIFISFNFLFLELTSCSSSKISRFSNKEKKKSRHNRLEGKWRDFCLGLGHDDVGYLVHLVATVFARKYLGLRLDRSLQWMAHLCVLCVLA